MTFSGGGTTHESLEEQIAEICRAHKGERGALLPILHDIQASLGYIGPQCLAPLAEELNISQAEVFGVVTFYKDFRTVPSGGSVVRVCRGEACQSMGAEDLVAHAKSSLGVGLGETTHDGSITLEQVFCLGNCGLSPAIQIDQKTYGRLDEAKFDALVANVREVAR